MRSLLLPLHIIAGTLGMLSGFVAVFLLKGSRLAWHRGERVCHNNACPLRKRGVSGDHEIPAGQYSGRHSDLLSGGNGMTDR